MFPVTTEPAIPTLIPDLREIPADRLADLGGSALAQSVREYLKRIKENGIPLSSFQARI